VKAHSSRSMAAFRPSHQEYPFRHPCSACFSIQKLLAARTAHALSFLASTSP
ncbi:hypothetical protein M9458_014676, partial [Cirrhinus mrigala]